MIKSNTSRKSQLKKQTAAGEAEESVASVVQRLTDDAPVPEDWAADILRAVLKWQIEQIQMKPSDDPNTVALRARDARTMSELVRTLEKLDAVNKRREGKGKKTKPRDDKAIKEQFIRKLDQLLAARDEGRVPQKTERG